MRLAQPTSVPPVSTVTRSPATIGVVVSDPVLVGTPTASATVPILEPLTLTVIVKVETVGAVRHRARTVAGTHLVAVTVCAGATGAALTAVKTEVTNADGMPP